MNLAMSATTLPDYPLSNRTAIRPFDLRARAGQLATWLTALLLLAAAFFAGPASAAIDLRVESRPIGNPIEAYVTVTNADGSPVGGLTAGSFTLTLDGAALPIQPDFSLPPSANPAKNVSIVFAMDYSPSTVGDPRAAMEGAVVDFINSMSPDDYAAIVKFNSTNPSKASVVQPLTRVGATGGKDSLVNAAMLPYPGAFTNVYDGINVALDHFVSPPDGVTLPSGPKAVVLISDGQDNASINTQSFVIDKASSLGIPVFTIAVGTPGTDGSNLMNALAARTGGNYISAPTTTEVTAAYATISSRLDNGYLLSFASSITDCNPHTLSVTVAGQGTTETRFTRCDATTGAVTVPNVVNQLEAAARTAITNANLVVGTVTQQPSATVAAGRVISQNPAGNGNVSVAAGSAVNMVVSTGPAPTPGPVAVPNVVNQTQTAATATITGAGLVLGTVTQRSSTTVVAGSVISQNPSAGTSVSLGSQVALVVSSGPVAVPNVVNLTQAAATTSLTGAGLALGAVSQQSSATVPSGSVISQNPAAGTGVGAGSAVALVVSTGPVAPPPPPPPPPSSGSGGGGGGSMGFWILGLGLATLAAGRRRRRA
jgi:beta-lactam-binding protein with PASTA domain